ncbi:hypothetical protein BGW39_001653 [Mortierella sp. 14UC]|nr:hypothetical protein BGW39_001653 [Mortierella sp. 14UC]
MKVPTRPVSFLGLSFATALTLLSFSLTSSPLSSSSLASGVYAAPVRSSPSSLHNPNTLPTPPRKHTQQQQHKPQQQRRSKTPPPPNKNKNNKKKNQSKTQDSKKKGTSIANSRTRRHKNEQQQQQSLVKANAEKKGLAPPRSSPLLLSKKSTSPYSPSTPTKRQQQQRQQQATTLDFDKPLLIIPPPRSVWHAGSVQLVKWSKTYARRLPKDTTVDIILADAKTNKKIVSLKRFIPFRKGSAQVWVPSKIPDNADASASYVLVLDLFHGKSQQPITVDSAKAAVAAGASSESVNSSLENHPASTATPDSTDSNDATTGTGARAITPEAITTATGPGVSSKKSLPSILRRSDINIYKRAIAPPSSAIATTTSSSTETERENHRIAANLAAADTRANVPPQPNSGHHHNDGYSNDNSNRETPAFYDFDNYLRQEYPNVIQPLELEHSFGVHQKVYSRAPYTLEWKLPTRAAELLDYTSTRLRLLANKEIDWSQYQHIRDNTITYQAKLLVELVRDAEMESVAVLARNVPAETKFQYLQILEHVEPAFYRLRVQMLVVEVDDTLAERISGENVGTGGADGENDEDPMLHGWDFAKGARIIDRYESITRKFWVSAGAL